MKSYQSHKVVEAARIAACEFEEDGSGTVWVDGEDGSEGVIEVPAGFRRPGATVRPMTGDYLVRYQPDGYLSWSPRAAFEAGYTLIEERGTPACVEVTVSAPAGKRAEVSLGSVGGPSTRWTVAEGQSQSWSVMSGEGIGVSAEDTSTIAHKRPAG